MRKVKKFALIVMVTLGCALFLARFPSVPHRIVNALVWSSQQATGMLASALN